LTAKDPDVVQFVASTESPQFTYPAYAPRFKAEFFNATQWVELFALSGAKYVVPTSKHHEGFALWNSTRIGSTFQWNAMDVGPHRDLIGEISRAVKASSGLHLGMYHSLFEWYNAEYVQDRSNNWTTREFAASKTIPELYDLVNQYQPELIWSDGDWEAPASYWQSQEFLAWLVNDSPVADTVVYNDRFGGGDDSTLCRHGSFYTCADRFLPGKLLTHKWENAFTLDTVSWGYRRNAVLSDYLTSQQLVITVIQTVALGGNALINIGPRADGSIDPIFSDRLLSLGTWLGVNGEAIYETTPWSTQNETTQGSSVWYTQRTGGIVYAMFFPWPSTNATTLTLHAPAPLANTSAEFIVGMGGRCVELEWTPLPGGGGGGMVITLPRFPPGGAPSDIAWAIKLQALGPR